MKKVLLVIAMVALGFSANAQSVKFGAKAGLNLASLNGNEEFTKELDSRTSFHIGVMAEIMLSDKFAFQPELLYSTQGATTERTILGNKVEGTFKLDYITIPLMAKYFVAEGFSLEAGPQLAFNTTAESKFEGGGQERTQDLKEGLNGFDFGLNFGLGYKLENGLNFGARYNLGLTDIAKEREEGDAVKNGLFQISVGYFF